MAPPCERRDSTDLGQVVPHVLGLDKYVTTKHLTIGTPKKLNTLQQDLLNLKGNLTSGHTPERRESIKGALLFALQKSTI